MSKISFIFSPSSDSHLLSGGTVITMSNKHTGITSTQTQATKKHGQRRHPPMAQNGKRPVPTHALSEAVPTQSLYKSYLITSKPP